MFILCLLTLPWMLDDKEIQCGPEAGKPLPSLKTLQVVGEHADKEVDWKEIGAKHQQVYVFVRADKWDRPVARVLKQLDEALLKARQELPQAHISIIWISKDMEKAKEYLPKVQQSIKLQTASWNAFNGEVYDVTGWQLSGDGALNIVVAKDGKAVWGRAFETMQESIATSVLKQLRPR